MGITAILETYSIRKKNKTSVACTNKMIMDLEGLIKNISEMRDFPLEMINLFLASQKSRQK